MTLIEVLAAIFIMGVGMLAVLVLYPLGALRMAAALKDGRCGVIASNADSVASMFDLRTDPAVTAVFAAGYTPPGGFAPADPSNRGYAVFVDPYYSPLLGTIGKTPTAAVSVSSPGLLRVAPKFAPTTAGAERWFTFLDDMTFNPNGEPMLTPGLTLERQWKYTWAYMLKRFRAGDPQTTELTVVVYRGRPITVPVAEDTYSVSSPELTAVDDTSIVIRWPVSGPAGTPVQDKPALRRGAWVLDSTYKLRSQTGGAAFGYVHAEFYKVLETTDEGSYTDPATSIVYNQLRLDIQPPLRDAKVSQLTMLEGAVEVFERGNGRK